MNISKNITVSQDYSDLRIDHFLAKNGISFSLLQKLLRKKSLKLVRDSVTIRDIKPKTLIYKGDKIYIPSDIKLFNRDHNSNKTNPSSHQIQLLKNSIIYQDSNLIAINKPSGLAVQGGTGTNISIDDILPYLKFDLKENPRLVHRIDKDTSGLLLVARNRKSADILTNAFRQRLIKKKYLALVKGVPSKGSGKINIPLLKKYVGKNEKVYRDDISGKISITNYNLVKNYFDSRFSMLELLPITGRTHQIRVHLKEIGHVIVGDYKYGFKDIEFKKYSLKKRLYLHAFSIELDDFFGKKLMISTHNLTKNTNLLNLFS